MRTMPADGEAERREAVAILARAHAMSEQARLMIDESTRMMTAGFAVAHERVLPHLRPGETYVPAGSAHGIKLGVGDRMELVPIVVDRDSPLDCRESHRTITAQDMRKIDAALASANGSPL